MIKPRKMGRIKKGTKRKLVIIIDEGKIDYVYSNFDFKYAIVDHDRKRQGANPVLCVENPDKVDFDLKELYSPTIAVNEQELAEFSQIYEQLVVLGF